MDELAHLYKYFDIEMDVHVNVHPVWTVYNVLYRKTLNHLPLVLEWLKASYHLVNLCRKIKEVGITSRCGPGWLGPPKIMTHLQRFYRDLTLP